MDYLLDEEKLDGPRSVRVTFRPHRAATPIIAGDNNNFFKAALRECQIWGGANTPLIPVDNDGKIPLAYAEILSGSAVDHVAGMKPYGLYRRAPGFVELPVERNGWGRQWATALLPYQRQEEHRPLVVTDLAESDPWKGIYAACLGLLPEIPDPDLLSHGQLKPDLRFSDFLNVRRETAVGSLDDIIVRLDDIEVLTPRRLSMIHLAYGNSGSTQIRSADSVLPEKKFSRYDAGPNVLVVCSPGNVEDYLLLWNLRSAHGDGRTLPLGVPLNELTLSVVNRLALHNNISRNGSAVHSVYVTSASLGSGRISEILGTSQSRLFKIVDCNEILTFGAAAGWQREEVVVWKDGASSIVPLGGESRRKVLEEFGLYSNTLMQLDVHPTNDPFPIDEQLRVNAVNFEFYAGFLSKPAGGNRLESTNIYWPTRLLTARAAAASRDIKLEESEPGRAARHALAGFRGIWEISNLAHRPLLEFLEETAARSGFGWYKARLRKQGQKANPSETIGPTTDELPERSFQEFKKVFSNSEKATRYWLKWAEDRGLIVKGFQLQCSVCFAKQWIPVAAFSPPIVCRGCAQVMHTPFGEKTNVEFKYRLAERLRRVYEHDAMGHLLALNYFVSIFGRGMVGSHPGMNVFRSGARDAEGEADILILLRTGEFVPVEVKRSDDGFTEGEIEKLDRLHDALHAPWSAGVVCKYGIDTGSEFRNIENRNFNNGRFRILLSYDTLLAENPTWMLGEDPFRWKPLGHEEIKNRELGFVKNLVQASKDGVRDWYGAAMLDRPDPDAEG